MSAKAQEGTRFYVVVNGVTVCATNNINVAHKSFARERARHGGKAVLKGR